MNVHEKKVAKRDGNPSKLAAIVTVLQLVDPVPLVATAEEVLVRDILLFLLDELPEVEVINKQGSNVLIDWRRPF